MCGGGRHKTSTGKPDWQFPLIRFRLRVLAPWLKPAQLPLRSDQYAYVLQLSWVIFSLVSSDYLSSEDFGQRSLESIVHGYIDMVWILRLTPLVRTLVKTR